MKRKIVLSLCAAACIGMLFGCGKEEAPEMEEIPAEAVEAPEDEGSAAESLPEEGAAVETDDTGMSEETTSTAPADGDDAQEEGQKEAYTADEMIDMLSQQNKDIIYAIQRGDLFYPLEGEWNGNWVQNRDGNMLMTLDADFIIPTINYAQGETLVAFRDVNYGSFDIAKVLDTSEHYCIPAVFRVYRDSDYITLASMPGESAFMDDDTYDFIYSNSSFGYTEYEGNFVPDDSSNDMYLMEGEKDEIKELGGYEGSVYKSVQLKCTARYYELAPAENYNEQVQQTKNGYEVISDGSVNPLEDGIYTIGMNPWYFFEVINE